MDRLTMKILLDLERTIKTGMATYWKPGKMGYTRELEKAGRYEDEIAEQIVKEDFDRRTVAIDEETVFKILR